jgi:CheY-like chemotaxis protein
MTTPQHPKLLLIDDGSSNIDLLSQILHEQGYELQRTHQAQEAFELLNRDPDEYSAVISAFEASHQAGFNLVDQLKKSQTLCTLPIIMQTESPQGDALQKFDRETVPGVQYYLTTPLDKRFVINVVNTAIESQKRRHHIQSILSPENHLLRSMSVVRFNFSNLEDCQNISNLVAGAFPSPKTAVLGISELMINAIEHGNLGITYEEKTLLSNPREWTDEIEKRLLLAENKNKYATLDFRLNSEKVWVTITDQGEGFNHEQYQNFDLSRYLDCHGRGIAVARSIGFDDVEYLNDGRTVIGTVYFKPER